MSTNVCVPCQHGDHGKCRDTRAGGNGPKFGTCSCCYPDKPAPADYPGKGDPWADFLYHRARAILWMRSEGHGWASIEAACSMDAGEAERIARAVETMGLEKV